MKFDENLDEGYDDQLTDDQWLSTAEVLALLKISRQTLADLIVKSNTIRSV